MKIIEETPPNYAIIKIHFPNLESHKPIFAFGDVLYNPFKIKIDRDFEIHEEAHSKRQGNNPEEWWDRYLNNKFFRLEEEIVAYGEQYAFVCRLPNVPTKIKDWKKQKLAQALSSELYGNMISYGEAEAKIRNYVAQVNI